MLRRLALAGSGLTFLLIGLASIFAPRAVAAQYAYTVSSADSFNEFHAVFTGFWLGLAVLMLDAARRPERRRLGNLAGIMIGLQSLARLFSLAVHGTPSTSFVAAMLGELLTAALILQGSALPEALREPVSR
jgi:hypothetical protein